MADTNRRGGLATSRGNSGIPRPNVTGGNLDDQFVEESAVVEL